MLCVTPDHPHAAACTTWLLQQIRAHEPGLKFQVFHHQLTGAYAIYLTAKYITLLKGAELLHLRKCVKARYGGGMRDFSIVEASTFNGVEDRDTFLNEQEKALIVKTFLDGIRAPKSGQTVSFESNDAQVPDLSMHLREGEPIMSKLQSLHIVEQLMPLHSCTQLQALRNNWVLSLGTQPLTAICDYFGTQIGLYFAWLGHYTKALCIPAVLGMSIFWLGALDLSHCTDGHNPEQLVSDITFVLFALVNCVWSTCYLESWKRRQAELVYSWGGSATTSVTRRQLLDPRPQFTAEWYEPSPVTGRLEPRYPEWKSRALRFGVSAPVTLLLILFMIGTTFAILQLQDKCDQLFGESILIVRWLVYVPIVIYAAVILLADMLYRPLAVWLNDLENYRTDEQYENSLIVKVVLFQCINAYGSLFYIAFYLQDMQRLRETLAALLISRQVIQNCFEVVVPYVKERFKISRMTYKMTRCLSDTTLKRHVDEMRQKQLQELNVLGRVGGGLNAEDSGDAEALLDTSWATSPLTSPLDTAPLPPDTGLRQRHGAKASASNRSSLRLPVPEFNVDSTTAPEIYQSELECLLPNYGTPFDDHLEMFIQFGYVLLFSPAFPMAAFWAVLNNLLEIRIDAFKLCTNVQRPFGRAAVDIGAWLQAMELMGVVGVIVNCALIGQSGLVHRMWPSLTWGGQMFLIFVLEHVILTVKLALQLLIPDVPEWVMVEQAKMEYTRREALKRVARSTARGVSSHPPSGRPEPTSPSTTPKHRSLSTHNQTRHAQVTHTHPTTPVQHKQL